MLEMRKAITAVVTTLLLVSCSSDSNTMGVVDLPTLYESFDYQKELDEDYQLLTVDTQARLDSLDRSLIEFEIYLNSELGQWGAFEPDPSLDILKTNVPVHKGGTPVEQFTIVFEEEGSKVLIVCAWSDVKIKIPIEVE